jgi:septal ring factor EnvC (AmiA/AmiB activator)
MESEARPGSRSKAADPAARAEGAAPAPPLWLAELERRVQEAVAEIGRLRQENRRLERELAKLRRKGGETDGAAAAWQREREEVRARVERLASHLEGLLEPREPPAAAP